MGSAIAYGLAEGIASGKRFSTTLYDCFISKGYTMRKATKADWKVAKKLKPADRNKQLIAWSMSPEPLHPEVPRDQID